MSNLIFALGSYISQKLARAKNLGKLLQHRNLFFLNLLAVVGDPSVLENDEADAKEHDGRAVDEKIREKIEKAVFREPIQGEFLPSPF